MFPVAVAAQSHDSEGTAGYLLVQEEHEGGRQHRLQQLGLQTLKQTQHTRLPAAENQDTSRHGQNECQSTCR